MEVVIQTVPLELIDCDPSQPRTEFGQEELDMLAQSIKSSGLLQPISLRSNGGGRLIVIAGERRLRAVQQLGWLEVPAIVHDVDDKAFRNMQLLENFVRKDLNPVELARAFKQRIDEGMTDEEIANSIGKRSSYVRWLVSLLDCGEQALHLIASGQLTIWVGWHLARLSVNGQARALRTFQIHRYSAGEMVSICERIYAIENQIPLFDDPHLTSGEIKQVRSFERAFTNLYREIGRLVKLVEEKPGLEVKLDHSQVKEVESRMRWLSRLLRRRENYEP